MNKNLKKLINKETYEDMLIFALRTTIIKPYLFLKKKTSLTLLHKGGNTKSSHFGKGGLRGFFKKLFKLETYENILIAILRFLINRNPISPAYALTKIIKRKLTKKNPPNLPLEKGGIQEEEGHANPTPVILSLSKDPLTSKVSAQSDPSTPPPAGGSAQDDKKHRNNKECGDDKEEKTSPALLHKGGSTTTSPFSKGGPEGVLNFKQTYHKLKKHFSSHHPYLSASSSILTYLLIIGGISFYLFTNYYSQANAWWNDDWHYRKL